MLVKESLLYHFPFFAITAIAENTRLGVLGCHDGKQW
jgi:hypothetical protein